MNDPTTFSNSHSTFNISINIDIYLYSYKYNYITIYKWGCLTKYEFSSVGSFTSQVYIHLYIYFFLTFVGVATPYFNDINKIKYYTVIIIVTQKIVFFCGSI